MTVSDWLHAVGVEGSVVGGVRAPEFRFARGKAAAILTALFFCSMDQQGSSVLPAKDSKVQPKPAMVPWWQANSIKANPILSITMAKRGNTRGTRPSQTFVDSRRCATDCLLCAMISCSGQSHRDSWTAGASHCSDVDLATAFFPSSPRNGSWRLTTAKTKSKQKRGKKAAYLISHVLQQGHFKI